MTTCIHCGVRFEGDESDEPSVCLNCQNSFAFPPAQPTAGLTSTARSNPNFDPYHTWLGIPPARQPPNYYRLLGLAEFEANTDVIATAADRQSSYLRTFLRSPQRLHAERLLAEVEAAQICLLSGHTKEAYDEVLSQAVPPPTNAATPSIPAATVMVPSPPTDAVPSQQDQVGSICQTEARPTPSAMPASRRQARRKRSPAVQIVLGGVAGCAIGYYVGFVWLPSLRARHKEADTPPELVYRQPPRSSSDQSQPHQQPADPGTKPKVAPPSPPTRPTPPSSRTPTAAPKPSPKKATPSAPVAKARIAARNTRSQRPADFARPEVPASQILVIPKAIPLPKRITLLEQPLLALAKTLTVRSPRLLTDAATLLEGESLTLEAIEDAGVRAWTINRLTPNAAGDDSPRDIGEFSERDRQLSFRWFSNASAEDEALLLNCMLKLSDDDDHLPIALREPIQVAPLEFDMRERRTTHSFALGAAPRAESLMLELGDLSGFPAQARFDDDSSALAIGRSAVIVFNDVPGAELEVKFQGLSDEGITIALTSRFRENSASVVPMTIGHLETTLRAVEKTIARTQAEIRAGEAASSRLRSQNTSRLTGAQAAGLAGLINKTQEGINSDERKLAMLQAKLRNGPTIRNLLDSLHNRTLAFRITAAASSDARITLIDAEFAP